MGEPDVADAYRVGGSTLGAAVFDRAGGVGPLRPARSPAQSVTDYAQQMLVCLRRWLPDRDLVVGADGGYAKREFLRHCRMSRPIVVVTNCARTSHQPAPARRPGIGTRPRVVGARLPSPTAGADPATQWIPYRATG